MTYLPPPGEIDINEEAHLTSSKGLSACPGRREDKVAGAEDIREPTQWPQNRDLAQVRLLSPVDLLYSATLLPLFKVPLAPSSFA